MRLVPRIHLRYKKRTVGRAQNAIDPLGKCGLAGTIVSQDRHKAAFLNLQIHMIQGALYFLYLPLFIASYIIKYKIDRFYDIHVFFLHSMSA